MVQWISILPVHRLTVEWSARQFQYSGFSSWCSFSARIWALCTVSLILHPWPVKRWVSWCLYIDGIAMPKYVMILRINLIFWNLCSPVYIFFCSISSVLYSPLIKSCTCASDARRLKYIEITRPNRYSVSVLDNALLEEILPEGFKGSFIISFLIAPLHSGGNRNLWLISVMPHMIMRFS